MKQKKTKQENKLLPMSIGTPIQRSFSWLFYLLFAICFSWLTINLVFNNTEYPYKTAFVLPGMILVLAIFVLVYKLISANEQFLNSHYKLILMLFLLLMAIVQIYYGTQLRFTPWYDMSALYDGAVEWVKTGTFAGKYDYMYIYPNNLKPMAFLRVVFGIASIFKICNFFQVGVVVNCLMCVASIGIVSVICKKLFGIRQAVFVLFLFAIFRPIWYIATVFYTDGLSMLFPPLFYLLYLCVKDAKSRKKQILYYVLMGLVAALGMSIKFPVFIMVIAVGIDMLINHFDWKKFGTCACCIASIILVSNICFNSYIYINHLDKEIAEQKNTPYIHWIMMGLSGTKGRVDPREYEFTQSFKDVNERNDAIKEVIFSRIKEKGYGGMYEFLGKKSNETFGDGTLALSDFLDDGPKKKIDLHEKVLYAGSRYQQYQQYCCSILFSVYLVMAIYALSIVLTKKKERWKNIAPYLSVFGLFLFLMMWEASGRYITCFVPIFFLCASIGIEQFTKIADKFGRMAKESFLNK